MSHPLFARSSDLKRLREEGFNVQVVSGHLVVSDVPYLNKQGDIQLGALVSELNVAGDVTTKPSTHALHFVGDLPCHKDGREMTEIVNSSGNKALAKGLTVNHYLSAKPDGGYPDYYAKMSTYANKISAPATSVDPRATPRTFPVIEAPPDEGVFEYEDTASSRAGIAAINAKLAIENVAIIGVGGTGSYVLDLLAKTPVKNIYLFDGDRFLQHNAFRSPGAASRDELTGAPKKVHYLKQRYSVLRRNIHAIDEDIDTDNLDLLGKMDFAFLCLDEKGPKKQIIERLEAEGVPFIDTGMGIFEADGALGGQLRLTTSTPQQRQHVHELNRIALANDPVDDDYATNIQIAELNALNAALAVIKWKKLIGFYADLESEHHSIYVLDGNRLINEDHSAPTS